MGRPLTGGEMAVLGTLAARIKTIVDAADQAALTATGVLDGFGPVAQDYADFHQRFALLSARLKDLMDRDKIVVNEELPASMGANARVGKDEDGTIIDGVDVRPDLVDPDSPQTVTDRAVKLLHEVSHNLYEDPVFPVRDYTYRNSWGQGYLAPRVGLYNADNYAEAAAQIAEGLDGAPEGYYRATGRLIAQRRALKALHTPALPVGPALAWVDIKVNRAWIRSDDYRAFARIETGSRGWDKTLAIWKAANPDKMRLLALEQAVQAKEKVIGDRNTGMTGIWYGLDKQYFTTADNISTYLAELKNTVLKARPVLTPAGAIVAYDPATRVLTIPYTLGGLTALRLSDLILEALVEASTFTDAKDPSTPLLNKHRHEIVELFYEYDRLFEAPQVGTLKGLIQALPATAPTAGEWESARDALDLAALAGITTNWHSIDYGVTHVQPTAKPYIETLDESLKKEVDVALEIGRRRAGGGTAQSRGALADGFRNLMAALGLITGNVTKDFPKRGVNFQKYAVDLDPFTRV